MITAHDDSGSTAAQPDRRRGWSLMIAATAGSLMFTAVLSMILITWFASVRSWEPILLDPYRQCPQDWEYPVLIYVGMALGWVIGAIACGRLLVALHPPSGRSRHRALLAGALAAAAGGALGTYPPLNRLVSHWMIHRDPTLLLPPHDPIWLASLVAPMAAGPIMLCVTAVPCFYWLRHAGERMRLARAGWVVLWVIFVVIVGLGLVRTWLLGNVWVLWSAGIAGWAGIGAGVAVAVVEAILRRRRGAR